MKPPAEMHEGLEAWTRFQEAARKLVTTPKDTAPNLRKAHEEKTIHQERVGQSGIIITMPETDRDAIIGRAVREEQQLHLDVTAADKRLRDIGEALQNVRDQVSSRSPIIPSASQLTVPADLSPYIDISKIAELMTEKAILNARLREAEKLLEDLGVRPVR